MALKLRGDGRKGGDPIHELFNHRVNERATRERLEQLGIADVVDVYPYELGYGLPTFQTNRGKRTLGENGYFLPGDPKDLEGFANRNFSFLVGAPGETSLTKDQQIMIGKEPTDDKYAKRASNEHALVTTEHDQEGHVIAVTIMDLGSKNGTYINEEGLAPFEPRRINLGELNANGIYREGDTLHFGGDQEFEFVITSGLPIAQFQGKTAELTLVQNPPQEASLPESRQRNEQPEGTFTATTWDELIQQVNARGSIQGSQDTFPADILVELINEIRLGNRKPSAMPRTDGLRDNVNRLLELD